MRKVNNNIERVNNENKKLKTRSKRLGLVFTLLIFCLLGRIAFIQIVNGDEYRERTSLQQVGKNNKIVAAIRGSMSDRNGYELVFSKRVYNLIFDPSNMTKMSSETVSEMKKILNEELKIDSAKIDEAMAQTTKKYVVMKKAIDKEVKEDIEVKLEEVKAKGISYEEDFKREYLGGSFAAHLLGFATNGEGRWGLEYQYNDYLKGVAGREYVTFVNDFPTRETKPAQDGASLILTIDKNIQTFVEEALVHIEEDYTPLKTSIIVMNPNTGEILAMGNSPNFDLNNPNNISGEMYERKFRTIEESTGTPLSESDKLSTVHRNSAISDTYEPGSTFKPLLVAAAFEENLITETSTFTCNGGLTVYDKFIRCMGHHGPLVARQILQKSCNVGVMEIAKLMGNTKFYAYQKAFGFGEKTGIDLPGEASGEKLLYTADKLKPVELATSSFGQSFQLTPLQMLTSFSAVINGGKLMRPYVVSQAIAPDGSTVYQNNPLEIRKVISGDVSALMRKYLQSVVDDGLAKNVKIDGYAIGGKTGTSEKLPRGSNKVITSFMTFAPANNPKIAMIVTVDDPVTDNPFGSSVAGPGSREILEKILKYLGVPKSNVDYSATNMNSNVTVGTYTNKTIVEAISDITNNCLSYRIVGEGTKIDSQNPAPGTVTSYNSVVTLNVSSTTNKLAIMPNLIDSTYEEAVNILNNTGLSIVYDESKAGKIVNKQIPLQGTKIDVGTNVILECKK